MFTSVEELDQAIAKQGVKRDEWETFLVEYPEFEARNGGAFAEFMKARKQSTRHTTVEG